MMDGQTGGVVPGIHRATTFARGADYAPLNPDNIYLRYHNENARQAEAVLSTLEGAAQTLLFPSGMAAVAALFRTLPQGATVLVQRQIYWGTTQWITDFCARRGIALVEVDASDTAAFAAACVEHLPALAWVETPSNPWLRITDIAAAAEAAHAAGLTAILCIGESEAERMGDDTLDIIAAQLEASLPDGATGTNTVIAYEPIWAIGTGRVPTLEQIVETHDMIRARLEARFATQGAAIRILYGGSVKPSNAAEIFTAENVDGALVGGASLKVADIQPIIDALAAS